MAKILVLEGYISKEEVSYAKKVADVFIAECKKNSPDDEYIYLDLNKEEMASLTLTNNNMATYFNKDDSDKYIDQLKNVDKVIMISSMVNFQMSPVFRNYFDHILVAEKTFTYKYVEKGLSKGLLDHLKVQVILAQGSFEDWYPFTKLRKFIPGLWNFAGAEVSGYIMVDGTKTSKFKDDGGVEHFLKHKKHEINDDVIKFLEDKKEVIIDHEKNMIL